MSDADSSPFITFAIDLSDVQAGFTCGNHALDDYFARHAVQNNARGIANTYVLRRSPQDADTLPAVLGFYAISMTGTEPGPVSKLLRIKLPKYMIPVALIGRLAVDHRAQRRRLGEKLLLDALRRVREAANHIGCMGVVVDAKDENAQRFYGRFDFTSLTAGHWPRRMFMPIGLLRAAL